MLNEDTLDRLFLRQLTLANQFLEIEARNLGLPHQIPLDLNTYQGQAVLRLFITYFQEEVWEASQCDDDQPELAVEELADALHFLVEACLLAGMSPMTILHSDRAVVTSPPDPLYMTIGEALHSLRQRPHKQTNRLVVPSVIHRAMTRLFQSFLRYVRRLGFSEAQLIEAYFGKAQVNQQRIDTRV